jgi:hypothetical protein
VAQPLVAHVLAQRRGALRQPGDPVDGLHDQVEAVQVVQHDHIEGVVVVPSSLGMLGLLAAAGL